MSDLTIEVKNDAMLGRLEERNLHLQLIEKDKEIERLHSIIKEVREYIDKEHKLLYLDKPGYTYTKMGRDILEILDKESE